MFLSPPVLLQPPPPLPPQVQALSEALEGVPEALTDRRPDQAHAAATKVQTLWNRHRDAILAAMLASDRLHLELALDRLSRSHGTAAGLSALEAMECLEHRMPAGPPRWLATADRQSMQAWILLGQKRNDVPNLTEAFRPLLEQDQGRHVEAATRTRHELGCFRAALARSDFDAAQNAAGVLLDLVDAFEK